MNNVNENPPMPPVKPSRPEDVTLTVLLNRFTDLASRIQVCRAGHSRGASAMCSDCRLLRLVDIVERDRDTIDELWWELWELRR